jgi:hypothetical protein
MLVNKVPAHAKKTAKRRLATALASFVTIKRPRRRGGAGLRVAASPLSGARIAFTNSRNLGIGGIAAAPAGVRVVTGR